MRSGTSSALRSSSRLRLRLHLSTSSFQLPPLPQETDMPRTIPWLTGSAVKKEATPQKRTAKDEPDSDHDKTPRASKNASGHLDIEKSDILRSSSPPTDPIRRCPSEEYLIEGFDNDDIWMMVEDEFYAVAQTFTQHMHYAEYIRRTKEAKARNAARIQDIARPTDGVTSLSEETRKKKEAEALDKRQKEVLAQLEDDAGNGKPGGLHGPEGEEEEAEEEDVLLQDDSWAGTSLYDLMMSPRKARSLVGSRGIKSSTRAAAGYVQTSQQSRSSPGAPASSPLGHGVREQNTIPDETASEDDEDDDLDVQPASTFRRRIEDIKAHKTEKSEPAKPSIAPNKYVSHEPVKTTQPKTTPSISATSINNSLTTPQPRKRMLFDDGFDRLPEPKSNNASIRNAPAKQQDPLPPSSASSLSTGNKQSPNNNPSGGVDNNNNNNTKLESKRSRLNEVPTFLL